MQIKTNKKILLPIAAILVMAIPRFALAWDLIGLATDSIMGLLLTIINVVINFVGTVLITIAGSIVNYAFSFQSFVKVPAVQIGWTLSRDLANMAFILLMLGIAFAYVLRLETYGLKKLLPKLIAMALLLNFSLIICGVFIDMGNSLGRFFVSGSGQSPDVGNNIMAAVKAGQLAQMRNNISSISTGITTLIMASVVQLIFYLILVFLLFALGIMMLLRIVNLWILIILAPLAWICMIIPKMESYYSKWWGKFLQQAFFPAAIGFFIFLGLLTGATFMGSDFGQGMGNTSNAGLEWILPSTAIFTIMQFIVVVMILFIGLSTAQKWGISGAGTMIKWAEGGKNWTVGKIKGAGKVAGKTAAGAALLGAKTGTDKLLARTPLGSIGQFRERLEKAPGIGRMIGGPGARFQAQQKEIKDAEGKLKNLRPEDLRAILNQVAITPEGQARRAAALSQLADKGQLKDGDKKYIKDFQAAGGNIKDLLERRLDWAFDEIIQGMLAKDFNFPSVSAAWKKVADETSGSAARIREAAKAIQDVIPKKPEDLANLQKEAIIGGTGTNQMRIKELIAEEFRDINSVTGKMGRLYASNLNSMINKNPSAYQELIGYLKQPQVLSTLKTGVQQAIISGPMHQVTTPPATSTTPPTPPTAAPATPVAPATRTTP